MKRPILIIGLLCLFFAVRAQTSYTWNGSLSTSWTTPGNWTPNGVPGSADNVTIVTGSNTCQLSASQSITNFTLTSGTLDLGGTTLNIGGATATFTKGTVQNGTVNVTAATTTSFGGGPVIMNCTVNISSATISQLKNTTFQQTTTITKTGPSGDGNIGGNTFNGTLSFTNAGTGSFYFGNGAADQFNGNATFTNSGGNNLGIGWNSTGNTFNGLTTFTNTGTSGVYVSWNSAGTTFNGNVVVNSNNGVGVQFCGGNGTASVTMGAGSGISIGAGGFSAGTLLLRQLTQSDATALNFNLTGTAGIIYGPSSTFLGTVTSSSPTLSLNSATFNGVTSFTKTGSTGDWSNGGNIFNAVCSITNSGSSYLVLGNGNPDTWNSDVTFTDNGSERLLPGWNSIGNQFNGNIYVNTAGSAQGIQFCGGSSTATANLAAGMTIQPGSTGLTAGYLYLKQFTQAGSTPITINATGSSVVYLGPSSAFGGAVTVTAPDIWVQGATYSSAAVFTKTGGSNNHNNQNQNIFNSTCTINQQSSTGYFMLGYNSNDLFNDNITVTSTGTGGIYLGWTSGTGTPTLAAGKTILVGPAGFSAGYLYFNTFTQNGAAPINLAFTGATTALYFARQSVFGGNVTVTASDIYLNGSTFNGAFSSTKTGSNGDYNAGGNTFNGICSITNNSSGYIVLGNNNPDTWNTDVNFIDNGAERILPAWATAGNQFNGNIFVSTSGSAQGIQFCGGNATATATQAAGMTVAAGSAGLNAGYLILKQFTQNGSVPINLTLSSTASYLQFGPSSTLGGNVTSSSPRLLFNGCTFNGTVTSVKNGATNDASNGNNIFNGVTNLTDSGSGYLMMGNNNSDQFNAAATFTNAGTANIYLAYNSSNNAFNGVTTFNNFPTANTGTYVSSYSAGTAFNNTIIVNSTNGQGVQFCTGNNTATATLASGYAISVGSLGFSSGSLILRQFTQNGSAPITLPLTGASTYLQFGPTSTLGGNVTSSSAGLLFNGCTFNGNLTSTKNGGSNDGSNGNNIFNGVTNLTDSGSGYLLLGNGNPDQFNAAVTFTNAGTANIYPAYNSSNNVFNGVTTFNNSPTANTGIYVSSYSPGTVFNNNILVSSTNGQGVQFCTGNNTATAALAAGYGISVGSLGFSSGYLTLRQFTQNGTTPETLTLTGTSDLIFGPMSAFGGKITTSSPALNLNGCTFNGNSDLTKTGPTGDWSSGGNVFNGVSSITNSGASYLVLGNSNPDTWNNDVTFTDNGSERLLPCWATTGNQFNGNIYVNTGGSAQGIQFCGGNSTSTAILAAGKTIQAGTSGLNAGYLVLKQFTQNGNAPINLTLNSTATYLQFGPSSSLGGNVVSSSPGLYFNGCTFNGTVNSTKVGPSNDGSSGNNIFNGVSVLTNAGAGYLMLGNVNLDQFNANATFNNTGSSNFYVAYNSANNVFNGVTTFNNTPTANTGISVSQYSAGTTFNNNIVVSSTAGQGVGFCTGNASATATLAAGNTISVGPGGFSAGTLLLRQFTQQGSTAQSLTLTGTGNLTFGPLVNIGGNITTVSPTLLFNGGIFNGSVTSAKNGPTNDGSPGNNTFVGPFAITNTGTGYFLMGNGSPDTWQSTASFTNQSPSQHMYTAYNSTGNVFNGDVTYNNQAGNTGLWIYANNNGINTQFNGNIFVSNTTGAGVYFGSSSGTATLAGSGSIGAGTNGFTAGTLILKNFTQATPGTTQTITTTGTSIIQFGPTATFAGPVTSSSPGVTFSNSTFNGAVNTTKTGISNDQSVGNNTFNAASSFTNNGTGYLEMTVSASDTYNNDVTFVKNSTGALSPNYNNTGTYNGNMTVGGLSATAITFGAGNGTAIFSGTGIQNINGLAGNVTPVFTRLVINNTGGGVTLNSTPINVSGTLTMTTGLLNTSTTNLLTMMNNSTTTAGTALSTSYVNGPMRYQKSASGVSTLNFPVGTAPDCRPVILTVNHSTSTLYNYTIQLFDASAAALGYTLPPSVQNVSHRHYYILGRSDASGTSQPTAGLSGNQTIQIFFGANDTVSDGSSLTIVKNTYLAPTAWIDIGGNGAPPASGGANLTGSITSTSSPSAFNSFSTFALGNRIGGNNVLPTELLYFNAKPDNTQVDLTWATAMEANSDYFTVERSADGITFDSVLRVGTLAPDGNSNIQLDYSAYDLTPLQGASFYRLKQTSLDGSTKYSGVVAVNFTQQAPIAIYPNPSRGTVYVSGLPANAATIQVAWYDLSGKLLLQQMATPQGGLLQLNTYFNNGDYILKLQSPGGACTTRTVIILK